MRVRGVDEGEKRMKERKEMKERRMMKERRG
jgi:hypothetical protein